MTRERTVGTVAMVIGVAAFALLGHWQWQRAAWKERLLAAYAREATATPRDFSALVATHDALPQRADLGDADADALALPLRATARGTYDPGVTVLLDNQLRDGVGGVMVLTLFRPVDARRALFVNRGWLALAPDRTLPTLPAPPAGTTTIDGLLVAPPSTGIAMGHARFERGAPPPWLTHLDVPALREQVGTDLFAGVLQLDARHDGGFRRDWPPLPNTLPPERHRGYAVQWYALALAVFVTWIILMRRRRR